MLWLALGWLLSIVAAVLATYLWLRPVAVKPPRDIVATAGTGPMAARDASLRQQLAQLRQGRSVDRISTRKLQTSLAERDKTINKLRAELAFYTRLMGDPHHGQLQIQGVHLTPVAHSSRAWNITLTLTRNAHDKSKMRGTARVSVQGIRKHKVTQLTWSTLATRQPADGMDVQLRYFQKLHATLMLPEDFTPNRLHVTVTPHKGDTINKKMTWADALKNAGNSDVQQ